MKTIPIDVPDVVIEYVEPFLKASDFELKDVVSVIFASTISMSPQLTFFMKNNEFVEWYNSMYDKNSTLNELAKKVN